MTEVSRSDTTCTLGKVETWIAVFSGYHPLQSTYGLATQTGQSGPVRSAPA